ncbi:hypothetical protein C5167_024697 [Papaver somniferum]|uniref:X8 domain-containing protein n=1 Tax=Papaver somniferum TaxID=3469 RepID=A0A4Y7JPD8_PAPSO|nr:glucan endo-1,3-beta-glucosidase 1-like [Papaver somniferum]RZC62963.1 hypothetical protein C5167_024697 [Papaver somniferum]
MENYNKIFCCIIFLCFVSLGSSTNVEDPNYGGAEQTKNTTAPLKFPPPPSGTSTSNNTTAEDLPTTYCVAKSFGANMDSMAAALSWTCGIVDCSLLQPGSVCFEQDNVAAHASYAFNLYYQKKNRITGSCDFNGTAMITTTNPSHGTCEFPNHNRGITGSASRLKFGGILAVVLLVWGY